jgi:hypothetical protein
VNRVQLDHVLRAATDTVPGADIVVIGSQSILASLDEAILPIEAIRSIEVDLAFFDDADAAKADSVDGAIGELSRFHGTFGYYGQGVSLTTATLPDGWMDRLVELKPPRDGSRVRALEPHDCVVSKLVAWRQKDLEFAEALLGEKLIERTILVSRIDALPKQVPGSRRAVILSWLAKARPIA